MKEKTSALVKKLNAETEVLYCQILAEANLIETEIIANARSYAAKFRAEADAYGMKTITETEQANAEVIAKAIMNEGQIETALLKGSKKKRKHLQIMQRLNAIGTLAGNKKLVIYGD